MTAPKLATTYEWGRMYARERGGEPTVPSITTVMDVLDENMSWWDALCAADCAIEHAERLVAAKQLSGRAKWDRLRTAKDWLMEAAERDRNERGRVGDLMHDYAEQVAFAQLGQASNDDVAAAKERAVTGGGGDLLPAFEQFWRDWQPRVLQPEATVWNSTIGYAGTTDLICELDVAGTTVTAVIDYKSKRGLFKRNGQRKDQDLRDLTGLQLCAAARAEEIWVPGSDEQGSQDVWAPFPHQIQVGLAVGIAHDGYVVRQYAIHHPLTWQTFSALRSAWDWKRGGAALMSGILEGPNSVRVPQQHLAA